MVQGGSCAALCLTLIHLLQDRRAAFLCWCDQWHLATSSQPALTLVKSNGSSCTAQHIQEIYTPSMLLVTDLMAV